MRKKDKEELLGKMATIAFIKSIMQAAGVRKVYFDGYENNSQMVQFNFDNHKCRLLAIEKPKFYDKTMICTMEAKGVELKNWENVRLNLIWSHLRYNTLERIAYEVYDNLVEGGDFDKEFKDFKATWFDAYDKGQFYSFD